MDRVPDNLYKVGHRVNGLSNPFGGPVLLPIPHLLAALPSRSIPAMYRGVMWDFNTSRRPLVPPTRGCALSVRCFSPAGIAILVLLLGIVLPRGTHAAGVTPLPVEILAAKATWVVRGRVESLEATRGSDGRMTTRVEVPVTEVWKGTPTNRIGVVLAGGILGNRRVSVIGQAEFRVGEEVVLFLIPNERGEGVIVELAQGKFALHKDDSGTLWVSNGVLGTASAPDSKVPSAPSAAEKSPANPARVLLPFQRPIRLSELKQRVQESTKP